MKKIFLSLGFLLSLFSFADAQTSPPFKTDFQIWNDIAFNVPLDKQKLWTLQLIGVSRIGNHVRTSTDERIGANILRKINKYATVGGGYLYRISNPSFNQQRYESRYSGIATFTIPFGKKTTLINRNQVQHQSLYSRPDATIFRTRFWLTREIEISKKTISPFVSYENFWDLHSGSWLRNRIHLGATRKLNKRLAADFYYLRQNEGGGGTRRGTLNAIGAGWRVNF
jgi:hypothetical protein